MKWITIIYQTLLLTTILLHLSLGQYLECVLYKKRNRSLSFFRKLFEKPHDYSDYYVETKFHLLTRKNSWCTQELKINNVEILNRSFFNSAWPTRILIHGWKNDLYSTFNSLLKDAYLKNNDFNVIIVDWGDVANDPNYSRASLATRHIGKIVAEFTKFLHRYQKISFNTTYLIGHSLGAQISGVAGYYIQPEYKFHTIFALDPAEPNFDSNTELKYKIDSSDANYVESIQTDLQLFGQQEPIGHAAFFPAYGKVQPGCLKVVSGCSHSRAYKYLAESINSLDNFWGVRCRNMDEIYNGKCTFNGLVSKMGGEPSTPKTGIYYVPVRSREPYAVDFLVLLNNLR